MKFDVRKILLAVLLALSAYFFLSPYISRSGGVFVSSLDADSKCSFMVGDKITSVSGQQIESKEDFYKSFQNAKRGEYLSMVVSNGPGGCTVIEDGYIGVNVSDSITRTLIFSMDIQGGVTFTLNTDEPEKVARMLEKRAVIFGVPDFRISTSGSSILFSTISEEYLKSLLDKCVIEASIIEPVEITDGIGYLPLGDKVYTITTDENSVSLNDNSYRMNNSFELDGLEIMVKNITNSAVFLEFKVFDNKDILKVIDMGTMQYDSLRKMYEFAVPIEISSGASERFYKILKNAPSFVIDGRTYMEGLLVYYLDGTPISQLNIPSELAVENITYISIVGFSPSSHEITTNKVKTIAGAETGIMPDVSVSNLKRFESTSKGLYVTLIGSFFSIYIVIILLIFGIRYKKVLPGFYTVILLLTNVPVLFGLIALAQQIFGVWSIGWQTLAGIISFSVITLSQIILSAEKIIKKRYLTTFGNKLGLNALIDILSFSLSLALIFTPFRFLGLTIFLGSLVSYLLVRPICEKSY